MEAIPRATTISEETMEMLRRSTTIAPETTAALRRLTADVQFPVLDESIREAMREAFRRFHELWEHAMPSNWKGFEPHEVIATIERVRVAGFVLVWIPRAEIVRDVLSRPTRARPLRCFSRVVTMCSTMRSPACPRSSIPTSS